MSGQQQHFGGFGVSVRIGAFIGVSVSDPTSAYRLRVNLRL
jgi:hypothetical protein